MENIYDMLSGVGGKLRLDYNYNSKRKDQIQDVRLPKL